MILMTDSRNTVRYLCPIFVAMKKYFAEFGYNLKLAYPVMLGMVGHTLISITDNIMVGKLGSTELAAVSLGNSVIFIAMSLGIGFSTAITPIVGAADAANDKTTLVKALKQGLLLCSVLGVLLFGVVFLSKPLLRQLNQPAEVIALAEPFIDYVALSLIPLIVYQGYKQFADGMSQTKYSLYAIILANVAHVILNYVLIYGIWIFPKLGIIGAAIGTVISRILMVVFMHLITRYSKGLREYFDALPTVSFDREITRKIVRIGIPSAAQMLFEVLLFTAAIWLSGIIGTNAQAANQIALSLASLTFMFAVGLGAAAMIRVSNYVGAQDFKKLRLVAQSVFLLTVFIEIVFALVFIALHQILPEQFLNMENNTQLADNTEVIAIAAKLLIAAAFFQIFDGMQVVVLGALRGMQDVKIPMYITFVAYWIVGFPLCYYLGIKLEYGAEGIWFGLLGSLATAAFLLYARFLYLSKKFIINNKIDNPESASVLPSH